MKKIQVMMDITCMTDPVGELYAISSCCKAIKRYLELPPAFNRGDYNQFVIAQFEQYQFDEFAEFAKMAKTVLVDCGHSKESAKKAVMLINQMACSHKAALSKRITRIENTASAKLKAYWEANR